MIFSGCSQLDTRMATNNSSKDFSSTIQAEEPFEATITTQKNSITEKVNVRYSSEGILEVTDTNNTSLFFDGKTYLQDSNKWSTVEGLHSNYPIIQFKPKSYQNKLNNAGSNTQALIEADCEENNCISFDIIEDQQNIRIYFDIDTRELVRVRIEEGDTVYTIDYVFTDVSINLPQTATDTTPPPPTP